MEDIWIDVQPHDKNDSVKKCAKNDQNPPPPSTPVRSPYRRNMINTRIPKTVAMGEKPK